MIGLNGPGAAPPAKHCTRLLATELTDLERQCLHKRTAEGYADLKQLRKKTGVSGKRIAG